MAKALSRTVSIYINGQEVQASLQQIKAEIKKLQNEQAKLPIGTEEYIQKSLELKKLQGIIQDQKVAVNGLDDAWRGACEKLANFSNIIMGIQTVFQMGDAAIGSLKDLAADAAALDDVYADVMKTTGLTKEQVLQLNESFKKMDTRTSREQLNQLAYEAGKLGISSQEAVKQFVSASDKINIALGDVLGEGAMVTIGKLSDVYASSTKQLADAGDDLEKKMLAIGSAINQLGQESTANEGYLVEFLARMGGIATQAGLSADAILGYASALDQDMMKQEMSATAFQKFIMQMIKKPAEFAKAAGMEVSKFADLMQADMNEALLKVLDGFKGQGGLVDLQPIFEDLGLDAARAASVISAMANSIEQIRNAQLSANEQLSTGSSIMNEFNTKNDTMQAQAEKAKKKFQDVRIELGEQLYPVLIHLTKSSTMVLKGFSGLLSLWKDNRGAAISLAVGISTLTIWLTRSQLAQLKDNIEKKKGEVISRLRSISIKREAAAIAKATAAEEAERLAYFKSRLEEEKKILADRTMQYTEEGLTRQTLARAEAERFAALAAKQQTIATNAATAATVAQKEAFAATPWGVVIAAVTALAVGFFKLLKSQSRVNKENRETIKQISSETAEAKYLFDKLENLDKKSEEYRSTLDKLNQLYPEIISKYSDEKGHLLDIAAARDEVIKKIREQVVEQRKLDRLSEIGGDFGEKQEKILAQLRKTLHGNRDRKTFEDVAAMLPEDYSRKVDPDELLGKVRIKLAGRNDINWGALDRQIKRYVKNINNAYDETKEFTDLYAGFVDATDTSGNKPKKSDDSDNDNKPIDYTGPTGETKEEKKARLAREAWERFEDCYDRLTAKMDAKELKGAAKVVAEVDASIAKMKDDLKMLEKSHPEAKGMLDDLQRQTEVWKDAQLSDYIKKMTDELDKQKAKLKETDQEGNKYINKMLEAQRRLDETFTTFNNAISQAEADVAALTAMQSNASEQEKKNLDEQIKNLKELIENYRVLKGEMQARVFDAISTSDVKASRLSGDESQWRPGVQSEVQNKKSSGLGLLFNKSAFDAYGRALEGIYQNYEKQKKSISEAKIANSDMLEQMKKQAEKDPTNKELQERIALREQEEERLKREDEALGGLLDTALAAAEEDAFGNAIDRWIVSIERFGDTAIQLWGNINKILDNVAQGEINKAKQQKDEHDKLLDEQLKNGLISQNEYENQKQVLQDEYDAKEKELQLEQWKRQKALNIGQATMQGAIAVLKALASAPPPANGVLAAISAALAATQIAAIASEPEPYAHGGYVNADTVFRAGEAGSEWIAPHRLLTDPLTAPVIQSLEDYRRGRVSMAAVNMPAVNAASSYLQDHNIDKQLSLLNSQFSLLSKYLSDPRNRQAVISRKTQEDFDHQEQTLRNFARL